VKVTVALGWRAVSLSDLPLWFSAPRGWRNW
jgi:hypothetical protein